jgi:hypothetical protein
MRPVEPVNELTLVTSAAAAAAAGPLFAGSEYMDFYNLELADTNIVDHNTHDYESEGLTYEVLDE